MYLFLILNLKKPKGNFFSCHGVFISRNLFLDNQFDEDRDLTGSEDYELWLRMASKYNIYFNSKITSALISHTERSVLNFKYTTLIRRKELMLEKALASFKKQKDYKLTSSFLKSNTYAYLSIHLALMKKRKLSIKYLVKTIAQKLSFVLDIRFFGVLKNLFF